MRGSWQHLMLAPVALLAAGVHSAVAQADAASVTPLECAYYYYLTEVSFVLAPAAQGHVDDIVGPSLDWAFKLIQAAPKDESMRVDKQVTARMHALMSDALKGHPKPQDVRIMLQPVVDYYDAACNAATGQPSVDLNTIIENASHLK